MPQLALCRFARNGQCPGPMRQHAGKLGSHQAIDDNHDRVPWLVLLAMDAKACAQIPVKAAL